MAKDKGWQTKLSRTLVLKDGTALTTLADVRAFILKEPEHIQERNSWQRAAELMIQAAEDGANIEAATAQVVLGSKWFREGWVMPSSFIDPTIRDLLCKAIRQRCVVELRYEQDGLFRKFEPHALYYSTKDNMCVSGTQTQNLNKPTNGNEPRIFDLSDIREVRLTALAFTPDLRFNRSDPRYKNGIICSV